jgi:uncharacterized repeat protein (TIGR01451 family)
MAMLVVGAITLVGVNHAAAQGKAPLPVSRYSQPNNTPNLLPPDLRTDVQLQDNAAPAAPGRRVIATSEDRSTGPTLATPEVRPAGASAAPQPTADVSSPVKPATFSTRPEPMTPPRTLEVLAAEPILPVAGGPAPVTQVQSAGVSVEVSGPATAQKGKPLHYEIVVRNTGTTPVHQVNVQDELPAGARLISTEPQADPGPGPLFWHIGHLDGGQERRFKVEIEAGGDGELVSRATTVFATAVTVRTRVGQPAVTLTMRGPEAGRIGDTITFDMLITNTSGRQLHNVRINDRLPAGLQHPQGTEIHADLGTLAAGETRIVALQTRAVKLGKFTNEATISTDDGAEVQARSTIVLSDSTTSALGSR